MKIGDLVKFKNTAGVRGNVFLVMRASSSLFGANQKVWIYPDPDADEGYDHTDEDNYYYAHFFEVVSESR